jgi:hypothetical protein
VAAAGLLLLLLHTRACRRPNMHQGGCQHHRCPMSPAQMTHHLMKLAAWSAAQDSTEQHRAAQHTNNIHTRTAQ